MVRKHRHLCVKTLIFNFQFTSNHSRWTVQHAGSTFWAPQLWSSCSWYRCHILGAENHINQQQHFRYLNTFKPNSTQNPGDSTCSNGEALVPISVSMTSAQCVVCKVRCHCIFYGPGIRYSDIFGAPGIRYSVIIKLPCALRF